MIKQVRPTKEIIRQVELKGKFRDTQGVSLPRIAITLGDFNGIGPEVAVKAINKKEILAHCRPMLIADTEVLDALKIRLDGEVFIHKRSNKVKITPGKPSVLSGKASLDYIDFGIDLIKNNWADCLITSPISKTAIAKAGSKFKGHTDLLQKHFNVDNVLMSFFSKDINVGVSTAHIPLKYVVKKLNASLLLHHLTVLDESLKKYFGIKKPRIALAAINPHASEDGNIGDDDLKITFPAVKLARKKKIHVEGPFPSDTLFIHRNRKKYDIILCPYHDQALIPFKMMSFDTGVNVTLNLPFIRTSPDHGTAYDIAWKKKASTSSMEQSLLLAIKMYRNRGSVLR